MTPARSHRRCRRRLGSPGRGRGAALALVAILLGAPPAAAEPGGDTLTAVAARTSADYSRLRRPDGTLEDEYYAFGEGGYYRAPIRDESIDQIGFLPVARDLAAPLARQHFLPTRDAPSARLLIMVYWGMTSGTLDPRADTQQPRPFQLDSASNYPGGSAYSLVPGGLAEVRPNSALGAPGLVVTNVQSEIQDAQNAALLGYDSSLNLPAGYQVTARRIEHDDLIEDVEHNRYFVVLMAYDFQLLLHQRKHKLLWEARFSVREGRNRFDEMLPRMAAYSAQYFGQDTGGLIRRPLPLGQVEIGAPRLVASSPDLRGSLAGTTLLAGSSLVNARSPAVPPPTLPPDLSRRIAAYQAEKTTLQDSFTATIANLAPGDETRRAIDRFNADNAARIVGLHQNAEAIRGDLAALAAHNPAGGLTIEDLQRQFSESIKGSDFRDSLFLHP